jgi:LmbE family N-acetylglucosaminyl deacetylase
MTSGLLVISPHCDDAVFACGETIATCPGAVVATVFAGRPGTRVPQTEWDRLSGFKSHDDVMGARREEDRTALERLGAIPVWMNFLDAQYGDNYAVETIAEAMTEVVQRMRPRCVLFPLGLFHSDHALTHRAALTMVVTHNDVKWQVYEDALYRCIPGLVQRRVAELRNEGYALSRINRGATFDALAPKRSAVECYVSQIRALATDGRPGHVDAYAPERFWALASPRRRVHHVPR